MESFFGNITDKNENNINDQHTTIKLKYIHGNENQINQSKQEKISLFSNNFSLFCNETTFQEDQIQINENKKNVPIKYRPTLIPSDYKSIVEPITFAETSDTTISNCGDIVMGDNTSNESGIEEKNNINKKNSASPLCLNFIQEVKYEPIPEREYYDDILSELLIEEENNSFYKKILYIDYQKDLDNKKRAQLISFIYHISKAFKFKVRTTFLTVQIMDRFFCKEKIDSEYYDLLCICCVVIASKFNEIYYPAYKDIVSYFGKDKNYTVKQALTMELLILKTIDYNLFPIFPMYFFDIISQKTELNNTEYYLGCLMIELIQFDFYLYPYKNSTLAQTVFCKVINLTKRLKGEPLDILKKIFPEENFEFSSETVALIQKASFVIDELLHNLNSDYFIDIYKKYSQPEMLGSSINYFLNM
jgi:hypothetical protein